MDPGSGFDLNHFLHSVKVFLISVKFNRLLKASNHCLIRTVEFKPNVKHRRDLWKLEREPLHHDKPVSTRRRHVDVETNEQCFQFYHVKTLWTNDSSNRFKYADIVWYQVTHTPPTDRRRWLLRHQKQIWARESRGIAAYQELVTWCVLRRSYSLTSET